MQVARHATPLGWKQVYQNALFEVDPARLPAKLEAAQQAIGERLNEVLSGGPTDRRELTELEDASRTIQFLKMHEQHI